MRIRRRLLITVCLLIVASWSATGVAPALGAKPAAIRLFVAPGGNDAADGSEQTPLATLAAARQKIRDLKKTDALPAGGITVTVRSGTYYLAETFRLDKSDSGTAEAPIVYRAAEGEKVQLIGGRPITGFVPHKGAILKANVASQGLKGVYFRQLFFDGQRQHLARYPNFDPQNPCHGGWAFVDGKAVSMYAALPGEDKRTLHYKEKDTRPWRRPTDGEVFIFPRTGYINDIVPIATCDRAKRTITLKGDTSYTIRPNDRYFVRNLFEELDSPGEWYLDRATEMLYFWPPSPLKDKLVCAPVLRTLIAMEPGTSHITIRGFDLQCCEGTAIELVGTDDCLIAGNTIHNVGDNVWGPRDYRGCGASVDGGHRNGVVSNNIHEVGSHGIYIDGGERKTLTPADNHADNNHIHHVGVFCKQAVGIWLYGVGNRASHNLIHDCPHMGIWFGGNNLVVEYNHIHHVNLETEDTGAIYTGGHDWISSRGSCIRYNYIHDVIGYRLDQIWGIYLDDNASGVDVIGNIIVRSSYGLIMLHNGRDNLVENNIMVNAVPPQAGDLPQVWFSGWLETIGPWKGKLPAMIAGYESVAGQPAWRHMRNMDLHPTKAVLPNGMIMAGNVFQRNIFYFSGAKSQLFRLNNVPLDHNKFDYNLVYHFDQPLKIVLTQLPSLTNTEADANEKSTIDTPSDHWPRWWRKEGEDQHSIVADPLFVDPRKDDYRLKPDSPAFKLGFKPIPFEKIGLYADEYRTQEMRLTLKIEYP